MKNVLEGMSVYKKVLYILRIVLSVMVAVTALMKLLHIWDRALYLAEPLIGALLITIGLDTYEQSRPSAIMCFAAAVFIFAVSVYVFITK